MAQSELYQFLKSHPNEWYSTTELTKILGINSFSVCQNINGLKVFNEIIVRQAINKVGCKCKMIIQYYKPRKVEK